MDSTGADTIFALSSGAPPAAVAIVRISGPEAGSALVALGGRLPQPRRATLTWLRDGVGGEVLDQALVLWFPAPRTATGEDCAELHLHGGRAVIAAVERALARVPGLRRAQAGEFTRRAFLHGRLDLAEAEGLADLLTAETELQRRAAVAMSSGVLSRQTDAWRNSVLRLGAMVEAVLDFSDEDDGGDVSPSFAAEVDAVAAEIETWRARPRAELLRDGFSVVLAGPPNSGKSTLFNALTDSEAAIVSPHAGTTRDLITRMVAIEGVPFRFVDTAGLRDGSSDPIECTGIDRAREAAADADLVLWLGAFGQCRSAGAVLEVAPRQDEDASSPKPQPSLAISAATGAGMACLRQRILDHARGALPRPGEVALASRQHALLADCAASLRQAAICDDLVLIAEHLRSARAALDALVGRTGTEAMLDALFSRFCIGK